MLPFGGSNDIGGNKIAAKRRSVATGSISSPPFLHAFRQADQIGKRLQHVLGRANRKAGLAHGFD